MAQYKFPQGKYIQFIVLPHTTTILLMSGKMMCFLMIISVLMNIESLPGYISIGKTKRDGINGKMNGGIHTGMLPFVMRWFHYGEKRLVVLRLFHLDLCQ